MHAPPPSPHHVGERTKNEGVSHSVGCTVDERTLETKLETPHSLHHRGFDPINPHAQILAGLMREVKVEKRQAFVAIDLPVAIT